LHTNSAAAAFARLQDLGISPHTMADCLVGVVAQRLLRRLCEHCKQPRVPDAALVKCMGLLEASEERHSGHVFEASGCQHCRMSGYHGRAVIMEVLAVDADMATFFMQPQHTHRLQQQARLHGYTSLAEEGLKLVRNGITSLQELRRVVDLSALERGDCA